MRTGSGSIKGVGNCASTTTCDAQPHKAAAPASAVKG
jgi:hypothetical protein